MSTLVYHKNALVLLLSNDYSRLACWASVGNHSSGSGHLVKETKSCKPQSRPIIHSLYKPVFFLMPPLSYDCHYVVIKQAEYTVVHPQLLYRALIPTIRCEKPAVCYTHIFMQCEIKEAMQCCRPLGRVIACYRVVALIVHQTVVLCVCVCVLFSWWWR